MTEDFVTQMATGGFIEPIGRRSSYTASRLAVLADGTTKPVLLILAERRFAYGWPEDRFPFWIDGDRTNETIRNVGLASRTGGVPHARRKRSDVTPGSKEYMKRWRSENRERVRASQRRYAEKREALSQVLRTVPEREIPDAVAKLEEILDAVPSRDSSEKL